MYQRQLTFGEAVSRALKENYCNFEGRASRSEYWWFYLFTVIISGATQVISSVAFGDEYNILGSVIGLAFLLPSLGLQVRRLHDIGKSGWFILLHLLCCIGTIILIVWYCKESDNFPNEYGNVPNLENGGNNVPPVNNGWGAQQ